MKNKCGKPEEFPRQLHVAPTSTRSSATSIAMVLPLPLQLVDADAQCVFITKRALDAFDSTESLRLLTKI